MNEGDPDSMAGYSGTPLFKKLKIKPGFRVAFESAPESFEATIGPLPIDAVDVGANQTDLDLVVIFTTWRNELTRKISSIFKTSHVGRDALGRLAQEIIRQGDRPEREHHPRDRPLRRTRRHQGLSHRRRLVGTQIRRSAQRPYRGS